MAEMIDVLAPLGMALLIAFIGYAMIHTGRAQRAAKAKLFEDFADRNGFRYQEEDDGRAQEFADGFDGVGRFRSSSLGKIIPKNVVSGTSDGSPCILFRHAIRYGEGWGRAWFVAGVTRDEPIAERCAVQFCKRRSHKSTMHLGDPIVKEKRSIGPYSLVVRAATASHAGPMMNDEDLERLAGLAGELPFRPEIQVRGKRVIAYPADRNATIDDVRTLGDLLEFTMRAGDPLRTP